MGKREKIIDAALRLLVENGIHATPMSAIAKSANTGMGTIYNYFENKEVLINSIYVHIKELEAHIISKCDVNQPFKSQLEQYYSSLIQFYVDTPVFFQFMDQLQASPIITTKSKQEGYNAIAPIVFMLENGQRERVIKNIDVKELLQFLGGTVLSYTRWYLEEDENSAVECLNNQMKMVWDAIKE